MSKKLDNAMGLYMEGIRDGNIREALQKYIGDHYIQHNTHVKDGVDGFIEFFDDFIQRNPKRDIQVIRSIEDGQYVFLHAFQSLNDGDAQWVTLDFFDTDENDKIVEHWDVITEYTDHTPSGHTSIDGSTKITDLDKTEANKELVRNLVHDVLMRKNPMNIDKYISSEKYIQHSKEVKDGLEHFKPLALADNPPLIYDEIVHLVGQGNFVATFCKAYLEGALYAQADLFRVENGLVVEHWDASEAVPPPEEWVNSGKF